MIKDLSFEVFKGECLGIKGESGSGKTTLLSTISGMLPYEEGEMYFNGKATSYYDDADWEEYRKNHIAFVFQNYNLIDSYTSLENVMTSFLIQGEEKETAKEKSMALLKRVGIAEYATHRATELSSGQKQRLSIARALARKPEILIFDDSFSALDYKTDRELRQALKNEMQDATCLIVAQRIGTIMDAALILVLENGRVVGQGKHKELLENCAAYQEIARSQLSEEELR